MKMAASASPTDRQRVETMMARRRTLNPNVRKMSAPGLAGADQAPPVAPPKPAWMQLREQGIAGQGSAAANKAALAAGTPGGSPPIMAPRPMAPDMANQAQGMADPMGERSGAKPWQGNPGVIVGMENQGMGGDGGLPPGAHAGLEGLGAGPGQMPPGVPGLPPEIMQRLQMLRSSGSAPGGGPAPFGGGAGDPTGGRGFVPPGQGAGAPAATPRPYGLQSFYSA